MANRAEQTSRMARAKVASIGDLIDSVDACIVGTVRARRTLFSPGRGTACVAYRFRDSMGHDEQREVPFVVEDDSGGALIDPSRAPGFTTDLTKRSDVRGLHDRAWIR